MDGEDVFLSSGKKEVLKCGDVDVLEGDDVLHGMFGRGTRLPVQKSGIIAGGDFRSVEVGYKTVVVAHAEGERGKVTGTGGGSEGNAQIGARGITGHL